MRQQAWLPGKWRESCGPGCVARRAEGCPQMGPGCIRRESRNSGAKRDELRSHHWRQTLRCDRRRERLPYHWPLRGRRLAVGRDRQRPTKFESECAHDLPSDVPRRALASRIKRCYARIPTRSSHRPRTGSLSSCRASSCLFHAASIARRKTFKSVITRLSGDTRPVAELMSWLALADWQSNPARAGSG